MDFWSQVRGLRRASLERQEAPPATSDPTSRQEVIESPDHGRPPLLDFLEGRNAAPAHWNAFKLPTRPQVYPERTLSQPEVKIGKKTERRHCTLPGPPPECIQITGRPDTQQTVGLEAIQGHSLKIY